MKRPIFFGLMFGSMIEVFSQCPPTLTLPTGGRGRAGSVGSGLASAVLPLPSPRWGGLGWGALEKQTAT